MEKKNNWNSSIGKKSEITLLLSKISDCKINFNTGTNIIIHSEQSELVLLQVLKILNDNCLEIENLSAVPTKSWRLYF